MARLPGEVFEATDLLPVSIRDKAYDVLKRAIVRGTLTAGQRLVEVQIAETLNVSRTPLREAILRLEAEGFVERLPSGGVRVKALSAEQIRELYAVRSVLEGLAAREAAERLTDGQIDRLTDIIHRLEDADGSPPNVTRIAELGEEFHRIILEASGNQKCAEVLRLLRDHINRYRHLTIAIPGRHRAAAKEHEILFKVLRQRNPEQSERTMRTHVLEAGEWMMRRLQGVNLQAKA